MKPKSNGKRLVLVLLALAGLGWAGYEAKYRYSLYADRRDRPWAFAADPAAPLLVGTWQGRFRDPDGVVKTLRLEILSPLTDDERAKKAAQHTRHRKRLRSRKVKRHFDGLATVTGPRGREAYEISGSVATPDGHQLNVLHFHPPDGQPPLRSNFNVTTAEGGRWQGDALTLTLAFSYTTASGSAFSSSADPRFEKKVTMGLAHVSP